jgi:hypothetical protein
MADQTMTVTDCLKTGILDITAHANKLAGNAAGADKFYFANDGRTFLAVAAGASVKEITFTAVVNQWGRTETLQVTPTASKYSLIGPFKPHLFNNSSGQVEFQPATSGDAGDTYLAVRIPG